jgi:phenylpropionate dioxygenase-like ring-hydroxylating dioxygenase large terminal subunit
MGNGIPQEEWASARSPGITYQELLDTDTHPVPDVLRLESPKYLGSADFSKERYTSREWHDAEKLNLWARVWQYACRADEIPEPGDYYLYEIAGASYIVMRALDGGVRAYPNACLHRGRQLKDYDGHCSEIRCPFHGFAWTIDGDLQHIPAQWDFPHVEPEEFKLPQCSADTWMGFVFINPDSNAEPLADFVGGLDEHMAHWDLERRFKQAHVAKVIHCNWKIAQEAFCEAYHVNATHPQIMPYLGDTNSQVDVWENFSRVITPGGTPSPNLSEPPSQNEMMRSMMDVRHDQDAPFAVTDEQSMRAIAAAGSRERWRETAGDMVDDMSDAEMMDSIDYTLFPNMHPWGAFSRIVYRFRPNGDDHRSCIMECIFLAPYLPDAERPSPCDVHWLEEHESFTDATELGMLGKVFNQDLFNMAKVQKGLEQTHKAGVTLANYQESKVRWLHDKLGEWVEG